ncbi:MAG: NAD(P)-binding domain-containing protein, partial [Neisseriaceae bacterium]|nr:NAD(P)-binding domain-containing protein [Neisseriaceae bacterium]
MKNLYFLGGGNMCAALLSRLKNNADFSLFVVEKNAERQAFLRQAFDITVANALPSISSDDILLLAVKPQDMQAALNGVETNGALVLSIAAGLSCQTLSNWLNHT